MNDLTGFFGNPFNQNSGPHGKVVSWYAKTVDINLDQIDVDGRFSNQPGTYTPNTAIYDRLGESDIASLLGSATAAFPWFNREGSGQGWSYSVLGGGKAARPVSTVARVPVSWDNTLQVRSRGDFAVPTLFDGNFDAEFEQPIRLSNVTDSSIQRNTISNAIAGWSFRNNATGATWENNVVKNGDLKDWKDIPTFADSNGYLSKLGIDPTAANYQPNYAIELNSSRNTITHNRFLVPDWGALRFDLFTGAIASSTTGTLKVFLDALDGSTATEIDDIYLQKAVGTATSYEADTHRIGYGETGFETFTVDIPDAWRGKVGTLRFELDGSTQPIYLDNVFFKSQHLLLGNPTQARNPDSASSYAQNYLLEKPQYSLSYSTAKNTPNWVSYQLNNSWLGDFGRTLPTDPFGADPTLPFSRVNANDYGGNNVLADDGRVYRRGHLTSSKDRGRSVKDNTATFLMTNMLPQAGSNNSGSWRSLERWSQEVAEYLNMEVYVVDGGTGRRASITGASTGLNIEVPLDMWKALLFVDRPITSANSITSNAMAFAFRIDNGGTQSPWFGNNQIYNIDQLEQDLGSGYDFWSSLPDNIESQLESRNLQDIQDWIQLTDQRRRNAISISSPLLVETNIQSPAIDPILSSVDASIRHLSISKSATERSESVDIHAFSTFQVSTTEVSTIQISFAQISPSQERTREVGSVNYSLSEGSSEKNRLSEVTTSQIALNEVGSAKVSLTQISLSQIPTITSDSAQASLTQINSAPITRQITTTKIDLTQISPLENRVIFFGTYPNTTEISLPSSITLQQLLSSHNPNPQNTTVPTWTEFLQSPTPFNLKIEVTDLPTGQLAEGTITGYDTNNRPNSGTLTLDTDGNSLGWFIDTTPDDNTEFDQNLTTTAFRATTGAAAGKYDLLTTILHELGHLQGIISGNIAFDTHVQNINGIPTFIDGGITATLTPDGSHLDSTLYPYDLMNTSLKPGVRKLPSTLDLSILNTLWSNKLTTSQQLSTTANLTAGALIGITNGDFTTPTTWNTLGATNIINGTATLTEQSQKLSELTQAFIIPTGAKTLQFTIKDNHLIPGDITKTANDAFEVALLDTNTYNPLAGTSIGLNHTDSLLNIQANGTIHKSDKVTITALTNNSSIVTIDLTQITPTQATLYFNLLGFGARTSTVTIDDVKLFTDTQPIPVTKNDTLVTNQNTPLTFTTTQLTTNDTNVTQIQIINQPTHGTLTQTPDGKLTYTPVPTYVGNDQSPPFNARLKFCR
jgi:DNA/RNA endonuclease G (NUC1)